MTLKRTTDVLFVLIEALVIGVISASACDPVDPINYRQAGVSYFLASPVSPKRDGNVVRANLTAGRTDSNTIAPGPVVLVPWNYGPDCRPFAWDAVTPWTPPNRLAFYTGALRPRAQWIDNLPTFDLFMAALQPVWQGDDDRRGGVYPKPYLTVQEFMELYALFPTDEELQNAKPGVRQRLEAWVAAHPALVKRFPANALLSHFQGALEQIRH